MKPTGQSGFVRGCLIVFALLAGMIMTGQASANPVWSDTIPGGDISVTFYSISITVLLEAAVIHKFWQQPWKKSCTASLVVNLASAAIGFILKTAHSTFGWSLHIGFGALRTMLDGAPIELRMVLFLCIASIVIGTQGAFIESLLLIFGFKMKPRYVPLLTFWLANCFTTGFSIWLHG